MKTKLFSDIQDRLTGYINSDIVEGVTSMIYGLVIKHYIKNYKASFAIGFLLGIIATGIFLKWVA